MKPTKFISSNAGLVGLTKKPITPTYRASPLSIPGLLDKHRVKINTIDPKNPPWKKIDNTLKAYTLQKNHVAALHLGNRLKALKIKPKGPTLSWMIRCLATARNHNEMAPIIANLLKSTLHLDEVLSKEAVLSIGWSLRLITDPFSRYQLRLLLQEYADKFPDSLNLSAAALQSYLLHSYTISQLQEMAIEAYTSCAVTEKTFPTEMFFQKLLESSPGVPTEAIDLLDKIGLENQHLEPRNLLPLLQKMIQAGDDVGSCEKIYNRLMSESVSIPDEIVQDFIVLVSRCQADNQTFELMQRLLSNFNSTTLTCATAQAVLSVVAMQGLESLLEVSKVVYHFQPNLSHKSHPLTEFIASHSREEYLHTVKTLIETNIDSENDFKTLVLNCAIRSYRNGWGASPSLDVYRKLVNAGFEPNQHTCEELLLSARQLRNCQKLSHAIYKEFEDRKTNLSRRVYEQLIINCLSGRSYDASIYFTGLLIEKYPFRNSLQRGLLHSFRMHDDARFERILLRGSREILDFPSDDTLRKSACRESQRNRQYSFFRDSRNTESFLSGWDPSFFPK